MYTRVQRPNDHEMKITTKALISLGANIASPGRSLVEALESALGLVAGANGITIHSHSRWFRTPAFPPGSGPDFVNGAALLETSLTPDSVLAALHDAETELGRARPVRWAPRVCDLDLIAMEDMVLPDHATLVRWMEIDLGKAQTVAPPRLILPHPRMHERGFVLAPLADIAPNWRHPVTGCTVAEMLAALPAAELAQIKPLD
jgi:2-amino-4-hydroxy-6-hydroxymethyldihydropteridine diphosphokinase